MTDAKTDIVDTLIRLGGVMGVMPLRRLFNVRQKRGKNDSAPWRQALAQLVKDGNVRTYGTGRRGDPIIVQLLHTPQ